MWFLKLIAGYLAVVEKKKKWKTSIQEPLHILQAALQEADHITLLQSGSFAD